MKPILDTLRHLEIGALTILFGLMVTLGLTQIILRNFAGISLVWIDPALRALVLWTAMLAAVIAAGQLRHIRIDILERVLPEPARGAVRRLVLALTALVSFYLGWLALALIRLEMPFSGTAFLGIPEWLVQIIVPVAFTLMGLRFLAHAVNAPAQETPP